VAKRPRPNRSNRLPTIGLDDLVREVAEAPAGEGLYLRWSRGPGHDRVGQADQRSRDGLTGLELPGLSASPLRVEDWWGDRPLRLWVARRVSDYRHLREDRGPGVRPWLLRGEETGRGPDNEPLVVCTSALAWISLDAVRECNRIVDQASGADDWGPLARGDSAR
jgi:hypothetical protein